MKRMLKRVLIAGLTPFFQALDATGHACRLGGLARIIHQARWKATISQRKRKMIETTFGWAKQYGGLRRMIYRGLDRVNGAVTLTVTAFNLLRVHNLQPEWSK